MTSPHRRTTSNNAPRKKSDAPTIVTIAKPETHHERIGDILRAERERRGDDIDQIAEYLCIRRNFLASLENNRYDELPADAYVIGFLRSYAEYLGLDGKMAIDRYRSEMAGRRKKPPLNIPTPITEGRAPSAIIMTGAAIAALLVYALWYGLSTSDRAAVSVAPPLPTTSATETTSAAPNATADALSNNAAIENTTAVIPSTPVAAATTQPPAIAPIPPATAPKAIAATPVPRLTITAREACWILLSDANGKTVYDHVMKPGETYKVPDMPGLTLTTGNGGGILLTLDGVTLPRLSNSSSRVMRNIPLDSASLQALPTLPE